MKEPQQQQQTLPDNEATVVVSGEETTLVAPRFDDDETLVARPVVPLEDDGHAAAPDPRAANPAYVRRGPYALRRPSMLALVLVSVLVGGVLGGAGLYLYQRQSQDPAVSPAAAATTQPDAPADSAQAPAAAAEVQAAPPSETQTPQPESSAAAAARDAEEPAPPPAPDEEVPTAAPARVPASVPAVERRDPDTKGGTNVTPKRGKKGERDEEIGRRPSPRPDDGNVTREARRVDSIFYRQRRAARRERARRDASDAPDRLRRIFEGSPE